VYRIHDGVKRAKASQLAGHKEILATVFTDFSETVLLGTRMVRIDELRTDRLSFAIHNGVDVLGFAAAMEDRTHRWESICSGAANSELPFPPIYVSELDEDAYELFKDWMLTVENVHVEDEPSR